MQPDEVAQVAQSFKYFIIIVTSIVAVACVCLAFYLKTFDDNDSTSP